MISEAWGRAVENKQPGLDDLWTAWLRDPMGSAAGDGRDFGEPSLMAIAAERLSQGLSASLDKYRVSEAD